jgi:hypothetical protein
MSVYKEAVHAIGLIRKNSKRIYPDACDYGTPVKKGDDIWNWTKQLIDCYGVKDSRKVAKYSTGTTASSVVRYMPDEHNSPVYKQVRVSYTTTRKDRHQDGYVTIEELS